MVSFDVGLDGEMESVSSGAAATDCAADGTRCRERAGGAVDADIMSGVQESGEDDEHESDASAEISSMQEMSDKISQHSRRSSLNWPLFPYAGRKGKVADLIWETFGDVELYCEPFAGALAVLLARPREHVNRRAMVSDWSGHIVNIWRSVKHAPKELARQIELNAQVSEHHLLAMSNALGRHNEQLPELLESDPEKCDPKVAAWYIVAACLVVGPRGLGQDGNRKRVHFLFVPSGAMIRSQEDVKRRLFDISRQLRDAAILRRDALEIIDRFQRVATYDCYKTMGLFVDPPYSPQMCDSGGLYGKNADDQIAQRAAARCIDLADKTDYKIAFCGYDGEHNFPQNWITYEWKASAGYSRFAKGETRGKTNRFKERIWFSPSCRRAKQLELSLG
jgi:site-specific DNA-adenine methylase